MLSPCCLYVFPTWSPHPCGPHIVLMLSPCYPHMVSTSLWSPRPMLSPCCPHVVSTSLCSHVVLMLSQHCPHVVPILSPLTHILTHPSTQPLIHPPIGGGVSRNHNLQTELNYLDQVQIYWIFNDLTWLHPLTHPPTNLCTHP